MIKPLQCAFVKHQQIVKYCHARGVAVKSSFSEALDQYIKEKIDNMIDTNVGNTVDFRTLRTMGIRLPRRKMPHALDAKANPEGGNDASATQGQSEEI